MVICLDTKKLYQDFVAYLDSLSDEEFINIVENAREYSSDFEENIVEVVRCRDCKYRPVGVNNRYVHAPEDKDGNKYSDICPWLCEDCFYSEIPPDDFYCAYGERKDD